MEERYCTNCRTPLPPRADRCGNCGEIAGEVFDGKFRKPPKNRGNGVFLTLVLLLVAAGAYYWWTLQEPKSGSRGTPVVLPSTRVVADRPGGSLRGAGASITEAQAIRLLQRYLVAEGRKRDCLVVSSQGYRDGAYRLSALERCEHTRLGRWRVNGADGRVERDR